MPAYRKFMSSQFQNFLREQCSFTTTCRVIKALLESGKCGEDLPEPNPVTFILLSLPSLMQKSEMLSLRHLQTFEIFNPLLDLKIVTRLEMNFYGMGGMARLGSWGRSSLGLQGTIKWKLKFLTLQIQP